jgi:hypothetical protein
MWIDHLEFDEEYEEKTCMPFVKINGNYEWSLEHSIFSIDDIQLLMKTFELMYQGGCPYDEWDEDRDIYHVLNASHQLLTLHVYIVEGDEQSLTVHINLFSPCHEIIQLMLKGFRCCTRPTQEYNYAYDYIDLFT